MAHVGVSLTDDEKDDWVKYKEKSNYGSMSEFVREAVRKEIRRSSDESDSIPQELESNMTRITELQESLRQQMSTLSDEFDDVAQQAQGSQYPESVIELADEISGEIEEVPRHFFDDKRDYVQQEWDNFRKQHCPDGTSLNELVQAFEYLEENLSYIETEPQGPSDYYRLTGGL